MPAASPLCVGGALLALASVAAMPRPGHSQPPVSSRVAVQDVAWSADGRKLCFSAMRVKRDYSDYTPEKWAVYRYDLSTQQVRQVARSSFSVAAAGNDPLIIVGTQVRGNRDLYLLDEEGAELARLTTDPAEDFKGFFIRFSRDGSRPACLQERPQGEGVGIVIVDAEGRVPAPGSIPGRPVATCRTGRTTRASRWSGSGAGPAST
jgi:hypothetical protein